MVLLCNTKCSRRIYCNTYKVGIDTPPASSYQLERTQARIDEIKLQVEQFNLQIEVNRQWYAQKQAEADAQAQPSVNLRIGIILIEFQDVKHYRDTIPPTNRPNGYFKSDFENMMFSENGAWFDTTGTTPHPENEKIFGSFKDYWNEMSLGKLRIGGKVVNPVDGNGVPIWDTANYNRSYYQANSDYRKLANEAITKAVQKGWISLTPGDSLYYDKLTIIFAQRSFNASNYLFTYADPLGYFIQVSEQMTTQNAGNNFAFTHMGIFAHEFGHNIGFYDEYEIGDEARTDIYNFCLMGRGIYNGPDNKGACPATLSAFYRIDRHWVTPTVLTTDLNNFVVEYDYSNPKYYRINPVNATNDEHFILEDKERTGFDLYIPGSPSDSVNQPGRLLVWHHLVDLRGLVPYVDSDRITIIPADDLLNKQTQLKDLFPKQFVPNLQHLNDVTSPGSILGGTIDGESNERPAHFALNGIQKLANGNTLIEEIRLNHQFVSNQNSGGWQTVSVPVGLYDYARLSIFPSSNSAYIYNVNTYVQVNTLANGPGYWVNFPAQTQTIIFGGIPKDSLVIPVYNGWNITGTVFNKFPVSNICTDPPGIIQNIYRYNGGYIPLSLSDSLKPGIGYWTKTTNSGNIYLNAGPCGLSKINSVPEINLEIMDKFIVTDSDGNSQSLYVSNIDIDTTMGNVDIELPPLFPELPFDSRFEFSELVKKVSADSGTIDLNILVHANSFPLILDWEINPANGINYSFISDSGLGKIANINSSKGKTAFNKLANNKIQLFAIANKMHSSANVPTEYSLEQNYPNPFNPSTIIKYALKTDGIVSLKVYNAIGEEIRTLINEYKTAGNYETEFNAGNLSSGVYIYKLQAGEFVSSRKMILLK